MWILYKNWYDECWSDSSMYLCCLPGAWIKIWQPRMIKSIHICSFCSLLLIHRRTKILQTPTVDRHKFCRARKEPQETWRMIFIYKGRQGKEEDGWLVGYVNHVGRIWILDSLSELWPRINTSGRRVKNGSAETLRVLSGDLSNETLTKMKILNWKVKIKLRYCGR